MGCANDELEVNARAVEGKVLLRPSTKERMEAGGTAADALVFQVAMVEPGSKVPGVLV